MKDRVLLFLKGMAMGGADIIPGVSGGTIAFITGIYEELIRSIKSIDAEAIKLLFSFQLRKLWTHINGNFLATLFAGILVSAFSLVKGLTFLLDHHPIPLWSFFFGLILISAVLVARQVKRWTLREWISLILGVVIAFLITTGNQTQTPNSLPFIFLAGAIAICAMILPGISGSFILLLLGKYEYIIHAIKDFDLKVIIVFGLGCLTGLALFSRVLNWLLSKYHDLTVALLAGFMIGSLNKIWPWKDLDEKNILPTTYQELGQEPYFFQAILFFFVGILLVVLIEKLAASLNKTK